MLDNGFNYVPGADRPLWEQMDYIENKAIAELNNFADDLRIDSIQAMPQNVFTAGLRYCCKMIFKPSIDGKRDYFKIEFHNRELVLALAGVYINICDMYNKVCQVAGLATFLGCSSDYLYNLSRYDSNRYNNSSALNASNINGLSVIQDNSNTDCEPGIFEKLNNTSNNVNIIKGIKQAKERQLQGLLIDGKGNLIGIMAILNHEFDYRITKEENDIPALTSSERLQMLSEKYRVSALPDKLSDN